MLTEIEEKFKNRKGKMIGEYRRSSVMLLIKEEAGELYLCFEVRALNLKHQPGDICLPGGKIEKNEEPFLAAIRETKEELNLKDEDIEFLGEMDYYISPYNSIMYSFVSKLKTEIVEPNADEVDHVFWVPLKFFLENEPLGYDVTITPQMGENFPYHFIRGGENYKFHKGQIKQFFYQYEDYVIWGFTAMIVKKFTDLLKVEVR